MHAVALHECAAHAAPSPTRPAEPQIGNISIAPVSRSAAITSLDALPLHASAFDGHVGIYLNETRRWALMVAATANGNIWG